MRKVYLIAILILSLNLISSLSVNIQTNTGSTIIITNYTSNASDLWITNEGIMDNVGDIFGSNINNNLGWITSAGIGNLTIARIGNCSAGQVVMNTTISGVQCVTPTITESDPMWNANYTIFTGLINNASYLTTQNSTYDLWAYNQTTATYNLYNAVWLSTYNSTYSTLLNQNCAAGKVVNGTLANGTFICVTPSNSSFNQTYHDYVTANYTNSSNFWDNMNTYNSTQMENSGGYLNILVSWLTSLFYTESEIDTKIINNQSYFSTSNTSYVVKTGDTMTGNLNLSNSNITNPTYIKMLEKSGNCDLTINHSICSNITGTYIVG